MKVFWIIIASLAAMLAIAWVFGPRSSRVQFSPPAKLEELPSPVREPKPVIDAKAVPKVPSSGGGGMSGDPSLPGAELYFRELATADSQTDIVEHDVDKADDTSDTTDAAAALMKDLQDSYDARPDDEKDQIESKVGSLRAPSTAPAPPTSQPDGEKPTGPRIEYELDGSMIIDDRFTIKGAGTEKRPYRVSWDLLVSAEESYLPRQDMYELPARISFFHDKPIQISGFIFSALYRDETVELMVMQNMWDGCCIGEPPTPYDAIEVKLREPMSMKDLPYICIGTLRGTLRVDPFVKDSWLLGLYVVEDATIQLEDF